MCCSTYLIDRRKIKKLGEYWFFAEIFMQCSRFRLILGINGSLGIRRRDSETCWQMRTEARGLCWICFFPLLSHIWAGRQLGCFLFVFYFSLFWEQLKRSVSFGCPLLQDYSLLNLLAAFSIIPSYASLPSCSLTSMLGDRLRGKDRESRETGPETDPGARKEKNGHLRIRDWI